MAQAIELTARQQTSRRTQVRERGRRADERLAQAREDHSDVDAAYAALERARADTSTLVQAYTQLGETLIRVGGDSRASRKARAVLEEGQRILQASKLPSHAPTEVPAHLAELGVGPCCATPNYEQTKNAVRCRLCKTTWPLSVTDPEAVKEAGSAAIETLREPDQPNPPQPEPDAAEALDPRPPEPDAAEALDPRPPEPDAAEPLGPPPPVPDAAEQDPVEPSRESDAVLATIERLAGLHRSGILTDEEFAEKKADLLDRL
jgi:hypothetical protein